jgi:hypothetical protein
MKHTVWQLESPPHRLDLTLARIAHVDDRLHGLWKATMKRISLFMTPVMHSFALYFV